MVIVQVSDGKTSYALYADLRDSGDLVIAGHDLSASLADSVGRDEYEYFYTVRAGAVPRVCELLGVERAALLDALRGLLAPHGVAASPTWRTWLQTHDVPYEFSVR